MKKILFVLLMIFVLGLTASAQTPPASTPPITATTPTCRMGTDPADPTFTWVPPVSWKLIKTSKPEPVTQKGGKGEYTCTLQAGETIAYPPDGGNPVVILCKNELVKGRPEGTEIPRESVTFNVTPPASTTPAALAVTGIPSTINATMYVGGKVEVVHSGTVNVHHDGAVSVAMPLPPQQSPKSSWAGRHKTLLTLFSIGAAGAVGGTYYFTHRGHAHAGPTVTTLAPTTGGGPPIVTTLPPH